MQCFNEGLLEGYFFVQLKVCMNSFVKDFVG